MFQAEREEHERLSAAQIVEELIAQVLVNLEGIKVTDPTSFTESAMNGPFKD
jgi:hypothetical protein